MQNKILITGATGFIGSHLVSFLLERGLPVNRLRLLVSENSSLKFLPKKNFDILRGDIRNENFVNKSMAGVETVYHLAACSGYKGKTDLDYLEVNIDGTQNLLNACKGKGIQKFVFFSSIAVYGLPAWTGDIINWDENHFKMPSEIYGKSKLEAEKRVIKAYERWDIPYTILRPTSVYGPHDTGQLFELYRAIKKQQFITIGNGKNLMDFVYVKDLVKGAYQAQMYKAKTSDFILAGKKPITFREIAKVVSESINESIQNIYIPKQIALFLSYILDVSGKIIGVKSPFFPSRVRTMTTSYYYNSNKARSAIGYNPKVSFMQGANITGKWLIKNKVI